MSVKLAIMAAREYVEGKTDGMEIGDYISERVHELCRVNVPGYGEGWITGDHGGGFIVEMDFDGEEVMVTDEEVGL